MDTSKLAPETRRVWEFLTDQRILAGFILISGTALTLRIAHRISEDLDFITLSPQLPRSTLDKVVKLLQSAFHVVRNDNQANYENFLIAGQSLHDNQQDFLVNGVKVSFFVPPDTAITTVLDPPGSDAARVATTLELFRSKAIVAGSRCISRDWVDLYVLFREHGFTMKDFHQAFQGEGVIGKESLIGQALNNLCRGTTSARDPGFENLMSNPPSLSEIADFFKPLRNEYEAWLAQIAFQSEA